MANEELNKELNQVKSDIAELREDMAELLRTMKDAGMAQGQEAYDRAYERARQAGESVKDKANEAYASLGKEVEERPLTSVLTAFATGLVVGIVMDRRH
jgi:ElaB/YqjD/DUF883 family membrane-anchored ribosome-binding protein